MNSSGLKYYIHNLGEIFSKNSNYQGWGRKRTGQFAVWCHKNFGGKVTLLEDGFIRSVGLGVNGSPSFSVVEDDIGIYYDATQPSRLENLLSTYNFADDEVLMKTVSKAIALIKKYQISKYNSATDVDKIFCIKYGITEGLFSTTTDCHTKLDSRSNILIIAQTAEDASLTYGMLDDFTTDEMIDAAISENPNAKIYLKIHPDVLSGKKSSDINMESAKNRCILIDENINPLSLLKHFTKVYTKTSQMGFEALLLGKKCVCFGMPFYAGWGVTDDRSKGGVDLGSESVMMKVKRRRTRTLNINEIFATAYILYTRYYNPYTHKASNIIETITAIATYKDRDGDVAVAVAGYFFGFSIWKHPFISLFVNNLKKRHFINPFFSKNHLAKAKEEGLDEMSRIYIWGKKEFNELEHYAEQKGINIYRIEDGFIRSVGLGSDLTQPYSLVIDSRGIYFDPSQESDLEHLLNFHSFSNDEIARAKELRHQLIDKKLSKYNNYDDVALYLATDKKVILVPGQVEDDASIYFGAKGMTNMELLQRTRMNAPSAYIIFKPHPDVLAGNRAGSITEEEALKYCDRVVTQVSLDSVLCLSDEVHTMTSLVGFEALMRGIKVFTYGLPFYAGWGLSQDAVVCARRQRVLNIDELTAATLLLYPHYIDPLTKTLCEVEVTLASLEQEKERLKRSFLYRILIKIRNLFSRRSQQILRFLK